MPEQFLDTFQLDGCVCRWRRGDRAAADELLRAASARLERLARSMLRGFPAVRGWAETADVLTGACLRLLAALRSVEPADTREFFALAGLQVRRELLGLARACSRKAAVGLDGVPEPADTGDENLELWCEFHEAVDGLPAAEREVVGLVFYHGWQHKQVAELLGVSERTVGRYWAAASRRIADALGGRFPEPGY